MEHLKNQNPSNLRLKFMQNELQGLRKVLEYLYDGEQEAFSILFFFKSNYKQWPAMLKWLKDNGIKGKKLVNFCKENSPDGQGYHMGATLILSRIKGHKFYEKTIKIDELS